MPRKPRYVLPGQPQHIIQRGSNRCPIFISDDDYGCFRHYLQEACSRQGGNFHAYVFRFQSTLTLLVTFGHFWSKKAVYILDIFG